jgi:hypothetical protein
VANDSCLLDLVCPEPAGAGFTLCGRLFNVADNMPIWRTDDTDTAECGPDDTDPPCNMFVQLYSFTGDLLSDAPSYLDACGRFRFEDVTPVQQLPFAGILAFEPGMTMTPSAMTRPPVNTGNFVPTTSSGLGGAFAYSIDNATYSAWATATADELDIDTKGAVLLSFLDKFAPVANVVVTQFQPADALGNPQCDPGTGVCTNISNYSTDHFYFEAGLPSSTPTTTSAMDSRVLLTNHNCTNAECTENTLTPQTETNLWGTTGAPTDSFTPGSQITSDCNGHTAGGYFLPFPAPTFAQPGAISVFPIPTINVEASGIEPCQ